MSAGIAYPRRKNFVTLEAVELLLLNFCVGKKALFRLKRHHPDAFAHA